MGEGYAWVTLATNDSYSLGALVLAHSLKQVGTQQQLAVLITPGVTGPMRTKLGEVFNVVKEVNILDSKDEANLKLLKRPELGITFTKLHCWRLTQFEKCVFLDADTLVLENCDELFEREELSAAPDIGWPDCFNSGVFVYRPSYDTYDKLIQFALEKGSFDGGDQGLLNLYFSDWAHKDISKHLPFIYNMSSTAFYSYLPAFKQFGKNAKIIHFLGSSKPWLQYFNTETRTVRPSEGLNHLEQILQLWWNIFCNLIHSKLSTDMTSHTDTVHGSPSYTQIPTHTSYYHHHNDPPSFIPDTAEDYQNVWDPWEEYDSRQSANQPETSLYDNSQSEPSNSEPQHLEPSQSHFEHYPHVDTQIIHHPNIYTHHSEQNTQTDHSYTHLENRYEQHTHNIEIPNHHHEVVERHIQSHDCHSKQNPIIPHNTNACFKADHCDHIHHPTYSQSQPPSTHCKPSHDPNTSHEKTIDSHTPHEPHHNSNQDHSSNRPPPTDPRLPDECVATTTVSNEITLQTDSIEASNDNQAGLAGAFANLTLGQARTPEQQSLDDHLRRQGWEVGNIDYLGKDSFDNIWSKICETLSEGTEKEASPPKHQDTPAEALIPEVTDKLQKVELVQTLAPDELAAAPEVLPSPAETPKTSASEVLPSLVKTSKTTESAVEPVILEQEVSKPIEDTLTKTTAATVPEPQLSTKQPVDQSLDAQSKALTDAKASVVSEHIEPVVPISPQPSITSVCTLKTEANLQDVEISKTETSPAAPENLIPTVPTTPQIPVEKPKPEAVTEEGCMSDSGAKSLDAESTVSIETHETTEPTIAEPSKLEVIASDPTEGPQDFQKSLQTTILEDPNVTKAAPVDISKALPLDAVQVAPVEVPKPLPVDTLQAVSEQISQASPVDPLKATQVIPENITKSPLAEELKTTQTTPIESPKSSSLVISKETPQGLPTLAPVEVSQSPPAEASQSLPVKGSQSPPVDSSQTPIIVQSSQSTPVKTSQSTPVETTQALSVEVSKESSADVLKQTPVEGKVPKEDSKGKKSDEIVQPPTAVTEPTPPITPSTPPIPKEATVSKTPSSPLPKSLGIDTSVPDTPPPTVPEAAAVAGPTPPPRKSSGTPKKSGGKKK